MIERLNRGFETCNNCAATDCLSQRGSSVAMDFGFARAGVVREAKRDDISPDSAEFDALVDRNVTLTDLPEELRDPLKDCAANESCERQQSPRVLNIITEIV